MEQIGLVAVFDLNQYNANAAQYIKTQAEAQSATERASVAMTQSGTAASDAAKGHGLLATVFTTISRVINTTATILANLIRQLVQVAVFAAKAAAVITFLAFAFGKLDKLLAWLAQVTKGIPILSNLFKTLADDVGKSSLSSGNLVSRLGNVVAVGGKIAAVFTVFKTLKNLFTGAGDEADKAAKKSDKLGSTLHKTGSASVSMSGNFEGAAAKTIAFGVALGNLGTKALDFAIGKVMGFVSGVENFVTGSVEAAASAREFNSVLYMLGQQQGMTREEIDKSVNEIRAQGIEMKTAQNLAQQAIRYELDLTTAQKLARVAQDAAVVGQTNSSEALDRLIWGMTTQQTEVLRTMGLNVRFDQSYKDLAQSLNKSSDALTTNERIQAAANAILKEGATIYGAYETAQKDAHKAMRSWPRYLNDMQIALGGPFLEAYDNAIFSVDGLIKSFSKIITAEGPVKTALYNMGAIASLATEPLANMSQAAQKGLGDFIGNLVTTFSNAAESALRWGVNIVTQLADGMVQGAAEALNGVMGFIGGLLESWLSPGSPPKVAPNLDAWGASAANEWLQGFSEADFDLLDAIQNPLKQVLDVVGNEAAFAGLSADMVTAVGQFAETGAVEAELFDKLTVAGGSYGQQLTELTLAQFQLSAATRAAEDADKRYLENGKKANDLTAEYNKMLRSGASKEALKAKLAEINAAKAAQEQAAKDKVIATDKTKELKSQADLQSKALQQILELAKAQQEAMKPKTTAKKPETAAGGKGGLEDLESLTKGGGAPNVSKTIDKALEDAKKMMSEKLADIFKPLTQKWEEKLKPALLGVKDIFDWFVGLVKQALAKIGEAVQPAIDWLKKIIPPDLLSRIGEAIAWFLMFQGAMAGISAIAGVIAGAIALINWPLVLIIGAIVAVKYAWDNNFLGMRDVITKFWNETLWPTLQNIVKWLTVNVPLAIEWMKNAWKNIGETIENIKKWPENIKKWFDDSINSIKKWFDDLVSSVQKKIKEWGDSANNFIKGIEKWFKDAFTSVGNEYNKLKTIVGAVVAIIVDKFMSVWNKVMILVNYGKRVFESVVGVLRGLGDIINAIVMKALEALHGFWDKVLMPIIDKAVAQIRDTLTPVWQGFSDIVLGPVKTALDTLWGLLDQLWIIISTSVITAWENLKGILDQVWIIISTSVINAWENLKGILDQVWTIVSTVVIKAFEDLWSKLREVWLIVSGSVNYAFSELHRIISENLQKALVALHDFLDPLIKRFNEFYLMIKNNVLEVVKNLHDNYLVPIQVIFSHIPELLDSVTKKFGEWADAIKRMKLPDWLIPGSPTPLEEGLGGIESVSRTTAAAIGGDDTASLAGALYHAGYILKNDLVQWMGKDVGLVWTLDEVKSRASNAMANMAEPLESAFYVIRAAAADAAGVVKSIADSLDDIKSMDGMHVTMYVKVHYDDSERPSDLPNNPNEPKKESPSTGPKPSCFLAGTKITCADKWERTIQSLKSGDQVLSMNKDGLIVRDTVVTVFEHEEALRGYIIINDLIRVTPEHPFYVKGTWKLAGDLSLSDKLLNINGDLVEIKSLVYCTDKVRVFNLHVEKNHNYFADGVLVHNKVAPDNLYYGGPTGMGGLINAHPNEYVLSEAMRLGKIPIPENALSATAMRRIAAGSAPQMVTVVRDVSVSFPGASISSDMDLNMVTEKIRRVVKDELRRR